MHTRTIVLEGHIDRVQWTLEDPSDRIRAESDVLELLVPDDYDFQDVGLVEKLNKGRILLSFPLNRH